MGFATRGCLFAVDGAMHLRQLRCAALAITQLVAAAACTPNDDDDAPADSGGGGTLSTGSGTGAMGGGSAADGEPCTNPSECSSGFCADGLCCDESCDAACASCSLPQSPGACSPIPGGEDPDEECSNGTCDGFMACGMSAVWSNVVGTNGPDDLKAGAVDDAGNILIVGGNQTPDIDFGGGPLDDTGYVVKLDGEGNHVWSRGFGGVPAVPSAVAVDSTGNVVVAGYFIGTMNLGGPLVSKGHDAFVIKLDAGGTVLWATHFGDEGFQGIEGAAFDSAGNMIVAGYGLGTIDFGGGPLEPTGDVNQSDGFVAKFDADGGYLWAVRFGGADTIATASMPDGDVVALFDIGAGVSLGGDVLPNAGSVDVAVVRLDGDTGGHIWSESWGNAGIDSAVALAVDPTGRIAITGSYRDGTLDLGGGSLPQATDPTAFVAQFDANGDHIWSRGLAGMTGTVGTRALAFTPSGMLVVAGRFTGIADLGKAAYYTDILIDPFLFFFDGSGDYAGGDVFGIDGETATAFVGVDSQAAVVTSCRMSGSVDFGNGTLAATNTGIAVAKFAP